MLFYELACQPEIFCKSYLLGNKDNIKTILRNVVKKGSIANLNDGQWQLLIEEKIDSLDEEIAKESKLKIQLQKILKTLVTRKKLIYHRKMSEDKDWLKTIFSYDIDEFAAILSTITEKNTFDPEDLLDSDLWEDITKTSSEYAKQSEEYIKSEIAPILHNAGQIDLVDPYFDILEDRYKKPFEIILNTLAKNNFNENISLTIHIKNQNKNKPDVLDRGNYLKRWQQAFAQGINQNIKCKLQVWHESSTDEMHDRHIIRDESFGATLPTGIDERKKNKTMWHDMGYHNVDYVLNDFRKDSSPFTLVAEVTAKEVKKYQQRTGVHRTLKKTSYKVDRNNSDKTTIRGNK